MQIKVSSQFKRNYKKLSKKIKIKANEKEVVFRNNIFDKRLKTHKLKGQQKEIWAFWIDYSYRIKFVFISNNEVLFLDIGSHKIYK